MASERSSEKVSEWDAHTAIDEIGDGLFGAELDPGWVVGGGVNGGYVLGVAGRAIAAAVPTKPHPLAVSAHYLSASRPGPARVATRVLREGGTVATVAADVSQEGTTRISVLATYGDLAAMPSDVETTAVEPTLPPLSECVAGSLAPEDFRRIAPVMERFDMRFDPACIGWATGEPSGNGHIQAWMRMADGHELDPVGLLMACDALPPVTFDLGRPGWAPTLELTVHVRAVPAPGWLRLSHRTRNVAGGMFEEDCEVWDSAGRLVAQSRQLAMQPRA
ncbi:thioesterase family protein [Nocardioides hwasunensis]|uniref:Thioesterase family protein n=1 Tax=Nocardioides hwasunensis TaxID=397258 RepID=A0ABR8MG30_9ACTN|nr:thioesterase family protein [Nocardioides hwasunensis]MBD3915026.1 thioesterase family protein [Nocardioides hwasunensis]